MGILDVILPDEMKDPMKKGTEVKKVAAANLIARRGNNSVKPPSTTRRPDRDTVVDRVI